MSRTNIPRPRFSNHGNTLRVRMRANYEQGHQDLDAPGVRQGATHAVCPWASRTRRCGHGKAATDRTAWRARIPRVARGPVGPPFRRGCPRGYGGAGGPGAWTTGPPWG